MVSFMDGRTLYDRPLYELIRSLLADEDRRREMSRKLHTMVRLDSAERICDIVEQLTQSEK